MIADRDTRSTGNTFLVKFDREGVGDGNSYYWISGVKSVNFKDMMKNVKLDP